LKVIKMRGIRPVYWLLAAGFSVGVALSSAQTTASTQPTKASSPKKAKTHHKRVTGRTHVVRMESAPAASTGSAMATQDGQQRAADQSLLRQQQAQSANAQKVNDQQVQAAQKQFDKAQREQRIQDAPGPAQTGVVPSSGVPTTQTNPDQRIQDAPGPAETLPQPQPRPATPSPPQV
jgi:hypothetical protein